MEANNFFKQQLAQEVWTQTYKWETDNTILDTFQREANAFASNEKNPELWKPQFFEVLSNLRYVPGGRIISNAGTGLKGTSWINCFVSGFEGKDRDSIKGIYAELTRQARILKSEGGYGFCINVLRPSGAYIKGIGSESPGSVAMLDLWDTSSAVITSGTSAKKNKGKGKNKIRKGAQMVTQSCWHPDIEKFIKAKQTPGKLTKFNMSVLIHDAFMLAVENHAPWNLEFPITDFEKYSEEWDGNLYAWKAKGYPTRIYKTYEDANELWDTIIKTTYTRNEPGVIFIDRANYLNNLYYTETFDATNPCLTGETLVYVADGRGYVSIKQLASENKDIPVFCYDKKDNVVVRYMRNPRITGYSKPIFKVTLDDGSFLRSTSNHKYKLTSGEYKEVKDLKKGDSVKLLTRYEASIKDIFPKANSNSANYLWLNSSGRKRSKSEHRLIAEFYNNSKIPTNCVVHHKDYNSLNNSPDNLIVMTKKEHDLLHRQDMLGDKNPMRRAVQEWSKEKWASYSKNMSKAVSGELNGRYSGYTNEDLKKIALELTKKLNKKFTKKEWRNYALENGYPSQFSKWREDHFGGVKGLANWAALKLGFSPELINLDFKTYKKYKKFSAEGYNCEIINKKVYFIKNCECCGIEFKTQARESATCSPSCTNKNNYKNHRETFLKSKQKFSIKNKKEVRKKQVKVYLDMLSASDNKNIMKKEWIAECKKRKLPSTINSKNAFKTFAELKEFAANYNHRVVSVEVDGYEDVYNGTVDEFHNFFVKGCDSKNELGKNKTSNFNNLQCGEQLLVPNGSCNLGAYNLTQCVLADRSGYDFQKIEKDIPIILRMQDSVCDLSTFPLEEQYEEAQKKRKVGIGYMGYGSSLYLLKLAYGSKEALKVTEELCSFVTNKLYQASALLAKEKGIFPAFDKEKFLKSNFVKQALWDETIEMIKKYGLRNSHLTTCAPTGNTGIFANLVSGGLEPVVSHNYVRTIIVPQTPEGLQIPLNINWDTESCSEKGNWNWVKEGDEFLLKTIFEDTTYKIDRNRGLTKEEEVWDYAVLELGDTFKKEKEKALKENKEFYGKTIFDLEVEDHLSTMAVFAKYIDSSISKTLNVPEDYPYEDFKNIYTRAYQSGTIKGVTTYRWGTMANVVNTKKDKTKELDGKGRPKNVVINHAPKRPAILPCDIHITQIKGKKYQVVVGTLEGYPFEIFAGEATSKLPDKGQIRKAGSKKYILECEGYEPLNLLDTFGEQGSYIYSKLIQHGCPLWSILDMCDKMLENVLGFNKAMGRIIKKYIKDDDIKFLKCSECGSTKMIFQEGCILCRSCGYSKCN